MALLSGLALFTLAWAAPAASAQLIQAYEERSYLYSFSDVVCRNAYCNPLRRNFDQENIIGAPGTSSALTVGPDIGWSSATTTGAWTVSSDNDQATITATATGTIETLSRYFPQSPTEPTVISDAFSLQRYFGGFILNEDAYYTFESTAEVFVFGLAADFYLTTVETPIIDHNYEILDTLERTHIETGFLSASRYAFEWSSRAFNPQAYNMNTDNHQIASFSASLDMRVGRYS